ncbi:MAG: sigma-70 family RNA polymerase sigma factor [Chthonomonadales bacterium]
MRQDTSRRLSDHEVAALLRRYQSTRKPELRDRIVMQYANLVESVARRFAGSAEPVEDLVQEGYIGLITAVDGYNADKGVKFSTYATHFIIGQIKHYLRDRGKIIKEPAWLQELNQRVTRVIESLSQELGRAPTHAEIAQLTGMSEEAVADLLTTREVFKVASLDGGSDPNDDAAGYDLDRVCADTRVEFQLPVEERLVLDDALARLKALEQTVIDQYFFHGRNQTEIARALGISCNYVSHILRNSTRKLRKIITTEELKEAQREISKRYRQPDGLRGSAAPAETGPEGVVDSLTRLYNRNYFQLRLEEELNRAARYQYPLAILIAELEGHQLLSRTLGTLRGDEVLRRAAHLIRTHVRRVDIVTRFGPQQFGLILPHTDEKVHFVSQRLAATLGGWIEGDGLHAGRAPIILRIGTAVYPDEASSAGEMVQRALDASQPIPIPLDLPEAA